MNARNQVLVSATQDVGTPYRLQHSFVLNGQTGIVVNVKTDGEDLDPTDEDIDSDPATPGQQVSLRAAIQAVNAGKGTTIKFSIPGAGMPEITLTKALPVIEVPALIDATTQSEGMVGLNGNGLNAAGLNLQAGNSEVRGMIFRGFIGTAGAGIRIAGDGQNRIYGNYFGVDATGNLPEEISRGILIDNSSANIIGGIAPGQPNIIWATNIGIRIQGADSDGNTIVANRIGLGKNGDGLINSGGTRFINGTGVWVDNGSNNRIGGAGALGNFIAGDIGILISPTDPISGTIVSGNRIGLDSDGVTIVGAEVGIFLSQPATGTLSNTTIENNRIGGNLLADVWMLGNGIDNTIVSGNTIGLKFDASGEIPDTPSGSETLYGVRMDGSTRNTIRDNTIAGQIWNVSLSGEVNVALTPLVDSDNDGIPESGGQIEFTDPTEEPIGSGSPTNGRDSLITGNILGMNGSYTVPSVGVQACGIVLFGSPRFTEISGNISAGHSIAELWIQDGDGHTVSSNFLGTPDGTPKGSRTGLLIQDPVVTMIGPDNVIGSNSEYGIRIKGIGTEITVNGNKIGTDPAGLVAWPNNIGISIADKDTSETLEVMTISGNTIAGNTTTGLELASAAGSLAISNNRIGLATSGAALANQLGISVITGRPEITGTSIAHNTLAGIAIANGAGRVNLASSPIYENGDGLGNSGIFYETKPHSPPPNFAALRTVNSSGTLKVIFALPRLGATVGIPPALPEENVTVEFYANLGETDTQGRVPLFTRQIDPTKIWTELFEVSPNSPMATMSTFTVTLSRRNVTSEFSTHRVSQPFVWPEISFDQSDPGQIKLKWPYAGIDDLFFLEENRDLSDSGQWTTFDQLPTRNGITLSVTMPLQPGSQFFRLKVNSDAALTAAEL